MDYEENNNLNVHWPSLIVRPECWMCDTTTLTIDQPFHRMGSFILFHCFTQSLLNHRRTAKALSIPVKLYHATAFYTILLYSASGFTRRKRCGPHHLIGGGSYIDTLISQGYIMIMMYSWYSVTSEYLSYITRGTVLMPSCVRSHL